MTFWQLVNTVFRAKGQEFSYHTVNKDGDTVFYDCLRNKTSVTGFLYCLNSTMMNAKLVTSSYTILPPSGIIWKIYQGHGGIQQGLSSRRISVGTVKQGKITFQCMVCIYLYGSASVPSLQFCEAALFLLLATLIALNSDKIPHRLSLLRQKDFFFYFKYSNVQQLMFNVKKNVFLRFKHKNGI